MSGSGAAPQPPSVAVLNEILDRNYWVGQSPEHQQFAVNYVHAPSVAMPLDGPAGLKARLAVDAFGAIQQDPSSDVLGKVMLRVAGMAAQAPPEKLHLRLGTGRDHLYYLDLGRPDGRAVQIGPGGWQICERPPITFRRTNLTLELPEPVRGGSLDSARRLLNIEEHDAWVLYVACRIASLIPGITHPVELVTGQAGTGKTGMTRVTSSWVDPASAMVSMPRDPRQWAAAGIGAYVLSVDNVSQILPWWSDLICKAASGDGWADRALYTNADLFVASFRSVVILNGITFGALRADLTDRAVMHRLTLPALRLSDDDLDRMWRQAHPEALGWLLDRTVEVLRAIWSAPRPESTSRLVKFAQVCEVLDAQWNSSCMRHWKNTQGDLLEDLAEGDKVAVAIRGTIRCPWRGTSAQLLETLELGGQLGLAPTSARLAGGWTPKYLSERLTRAETALQSLGWLVERRRSNGVRMIILEPPAGAGGAGQDGTFQTPYGNLPDN